MADVWYSGVWFSEKKTGWWTTPWWNEPDTEVDTPDAHDGVPGVWTKGRTIYDSIRRKKKAKPKLAEKLPLPTSLAEQVNKVEDTKDDYSAKLEALEVLRERGEAIEDQILVNLKRKVSTLQKYLDMLQEKAFEEQETYAIILALDDD